MSRELHAALVISVCALVTLALRALPFVCFVGKHGIPRRIVRLGSVLPPAIMAALVVYCLKGVPYGTVREGACQLIAAAAVVALHVWKRSTLLSIGAGTALYMILIWL